MSNNISGSHSEYTDNTQYTWSKEHGKSRRSYDSDCSDDYTYTDTGNCSDTRGCSDHSDDSCRSKKKHRDHCKDDCGLKYSHTPVGVWNLIFQYETMTSTNATTTTTLDRPPQLLLNSGGTYTGNSTPDLKNNPFGVLLSTGVGVWNIIGERKVKLEATHIGYKASDGSPSVYYKIHITMKLNKRGTKARFCGQAIPKNIDDPSLCTNTNGTVVCFSGHGYKVLEPKN